jgi:hypothetical protein
MPHQPGHNGRFGVGFEDFFEEIPETAFFSAFPSQGLTPNMRQFLPQAFSQAHNEFLGLLGSQIRSGQPPTARFGQEASNFPLLQRFQESQFGGFNQQRFNPTTRSLFNF